jgi:uncharacterized glyoxalase superfamily protein PhnB
MLVEGAGDEIAHSELVFAEALIMISGTNGTEPWQEAYKSPQQAGGVTQALAFHIDDVDAHHTRAVRAGARIVREPRTNDYGPEFWSDRSYGALDPEGHLWWFMQRMRG